MFRADEAHGFDLSPCDVRSQAIASFGSKGLVDPEKGCEVRQQIEMRGAGLRTVAQILLGTTETRTSAMSRSTASGG